MSVTFRKGEKNANVEYSSIHNLWVDADGNTVKRSVRTELFGAWLAKEPTPYDELLEKVEAKLSEMERYQFNLKVLKDSLDELMKAERIEQLRKDVASMTNEQKDDLKQLLETTQCFSSVGGCIDSNIYMSSYFI